MKNKQNRARVEDALKYLHECEYEGGGQPGTVESVAGALGCSRDESVELLASLLQTGWVECSGHEMRLSITGRDVARQIVRTHRLYETYLASQSSIPSSMWHHEADRMEHKLSPEQAESLDHQLGHPRYDPHGDPIPTAKGVLPPSEGMGVMLETLAFAPGDVVEICHLSDEPERIGRSLAGHGLAPGQRLRLDEKSNTGWRVEVEGRTLELSREEACGIQVRKTDDKTMPDMVSLFSLSEGQSGVVCRLSPDCRGPQRNRLLDLGFVRGSRVEVEGSSPLGRPTAYRVRGTLIALRPPQARWILLQKESVQ